MLKPNQAAIPCMLSKGAFSGERACKIVDAYDVTHKTLVGELHCWDAFGFRTNHKTLGGEITGIVAARVVDKNYGKHDIVDVELPNGEVYSVQTNYLIPRPETDAREIARLRTETTERKDVKPSAKIAAEILRGVLEAFDLHSGAVTLGRSENTWIIYVFDPAALPLAHIATRQKAVPIRYEFVGRITPATTLSTGNKE